uniref:Uncharacterized protein n=1 Tax=Sphaerodactylus townsendi TaxID=933632 RepID=A0ACB8G927_9SAUR
MARLCLRKHQYLFTLQSRTHVNYDIKGDVNTLSKRACQAGVTSYEYEIWSNDAYAVKEVPLDSNLEVKVDLCGNEAHSEVAIACEYRIATKDRRQSEPPEVLLGCFQELEHSKTPKDGGNSCCL